jgi:hypothetical protein
VNGYPGFKMACQGNLGSEMHAGKLLLTAFAAVRYSYPLYVREAPPIPRAFAIALSPLFSTAAAPATERRGAVRNFGAGF